MVLNAVQYGVKCKTKRINMRRNGINKTLKNHEIHGKKGQNGGYKVGFGGLKVVFWAAKIMSWQPI